MSNDDAKEIPDKWADIIISSNALEHVFCPYSVLSILYTKLRPGGLIIFVVPCDSVKLAYKENDINQHLFSWSPMNLGNLFTNIGFSVVESRPYLHKWPPHYLWIAKHFGRTGFEICARIYGWYKRDWS